ncbi:hypothetical protein NCHU2750_15410 [Neorhizobium sp. NCHU2750]|nr:hypothetical protein NCHU2750_15410 [Neorhizobium sp. NCHU2750]
MGGLSGGDSTEKATSGWGFSNPPVGKFLGNAPAPGPYSGSHSSIGTTFNVISTIDGVAGPENGSAPPDPVCNTDDTTRNDICAQWRAADAAANAVNIGWYQFYLSLFGTLISIFTLLAAIGAAIFAKNAAASASAANDIAKNTERPWIFVEASLLPSVLKVTSDKRAIVVGTRVHLINKGASPAFDIHLRWDAIQSNHFDFDKEYKRLLDKPDVQNPRHVAPLIDDVWLDNESHSIEFDPRHDPGSAIISLMVSYKSPTSDRPLHTCVFFTLNEKDYVPTLEGNPYHTKMV